jgi:hypothetical protein
MNGLSKSIGLLAALCMLVLVISVGAGIMYELLESSPESEETSAFARGKSFQEIQETREEVTPAGFQWTGHSVLPNGSISIQVTYTGPTIEQFDEKDIDFSVNGNPCAWHGRIVKEKGGQLTALHDGESIYILVNFQCAVKKGDIITFVYSPLNIKISREL